MNNIERLKKANYPLKQAKTTTFSDPHDCEPTEVELIKWLSNKSDDTFMLEADRTEDGMSYWCVWFLFEHEEYETKHADLMETLVLAVEALTNNICMK